jgi:hypothetical protein
MFEEADPRLGAARPGERDRSAQILDDALEKLPTLDFEAGQLRPRLERPARAVEFPLRADAIVSGEKPQKPAGAPRCVGPGCGLSHEPLLLTLSAGAGRV